MRVTSGEASTAHHTVCPFCESGLLVSRGPGFARCGSCGLPLLGSALETLRDIVGLPDALGSHACEECGHPEMRLLPDGVFHCPACGSEVLPVEVTEDRGEQDDGTLRSHQAASRRDGPRSKAEPSGQGVAEVPQEGAGVSDRALAWEAKRIGGRLFKLIKASRDAD